MELYRAWKGSLVKVKRRLFFSAALKFKFQNGRRSQTWNNVRGSLVIPSYRVSTQTKDSFRPLMAQAPDNQT